MAKFEIIMYFIHADRTPGVLRHTVTGKKKVRRQCAKNREWLQEEGHREVSCRVLEVGSVPYRREQEDEV